RAQRPSTSAPRNGDARQDLRAWPRTSSRRRPARSAGRSAFARFVHGGPRRTLVQRGGFVAFFMTPVWWTEPMSCPGAIEIRPIRTADKASFLVLDIEFLITSHLAKPFYDTYVAR